MNKFIYCSLLLLTIFSCTKEPEPSTGTGTLFTVIRYEGINGTIRLPLATLRNATVSLLDGDREIASAKSDIAGNVVITGILPGTYKARLSHEYCPSLVLDEVVIRANEITKLKNYMFDCVFLSKSQPEKKKWTVIHFANVADPQISVGIMSDLRKIEKEGGSGPEVHHVVYIPAAVNAVKSQLAYMVNRNFDVPDEELYGLFAPKLYSPAYYFDDYEYKDADPADYKVLEKSMLEISKLFPSDSLMLFVYDHGDGINIPYDATSIKPSAISVNSFTRQAITMPQLRMVLNNVRDQVQPVSVMVMFACLMGTFEVAYELKDCGVKYIVASEPTSSGKVNFNCENWVAALNNGQISGGEAARRITQSTSGNVFATYDMKYFGELVRLFNEFANKAVLTDTAFIRSIIARSFKQQETGDPNDLCCSSYDIADLTKNITEATFDDVAGIKTAAQQLYDMLRVSGPGHFIAEWHNPREDYRRACGIAVLMRAPNFPYAGHNQKIYRQHKYYLDGNTVWDRLLMALDK